jgi:hypothetical protein
MFTFNLNCPGNFSESAFKAACREVEDVVTFRVTLCLSFSSIAVTGLYPGTWSRGITEIPTISHFQTSRPGIGHKSYRLVRLRIDRIDAECVMRIFEV